MLFITYHAAKTIDDSQEEEENMKYIPDKSKTIDNSIIINYRNNENSNESNINGINDITWIYKGQANIYSIPNGYGVKFIKITNHYMYT